MSASGSTNSVRSDASDFNPNLGYDNVIRLVVIGDAAVGKSSIVNFLITKEIAKGKYEPTNHADIVRYELQSDPVTKARILFDVWDLSGQEKYRHLVKSFYHNAAVFVLVYDVTNYTSFRKLPDWIEDAKIHILPRHAFFVVIGNKIDGPETQREVSEEESDEFAVIYDVDYYEVSAFTGNGITKAFEDIAFKCEQMITEGSMRELEGWDGFRTAANSHLIRPIYKGSWLRKLCCLRKR